MDLNVHVLVSSIATDKIFSYLVLSEMFIVWCATRLLFCLIIYY